MKRRVYYNEIIAKWQLINDHKVEKNLSQKDVVRLLRTNSLRRVGVDAGYYYTKDITA